MRANLTDLAPQPNPVRVQGGITSISVSAEFTAIYHAEVQYILRSLRRLGVQERDIEDLAHDVFLAAYRRFDDYDRTRAARPWLFGFAFRMAADHRRLFRHKYENHEEVETRDTRRLQDDQLADQQARDLLLRALEEMEFERRGIFVMHELDGHGMPEIAQVLAIPLNTAYSRLRLARRDFDSIVQRLMKPTARSVERP